MGSNQSDSHFTPWIFICAIFDRQICRYIKRRFVPLNFSTDYTVRKETLIQQFSKPILTLFFDWNSFELRSDSSEKRNRRIETGTNSDLSENIFLSQDYTSIDKEAFNYLI